jgi:hypothetical protein
VRWIDRSRILRKLPPEWLEQSTELLNQLINAPDEDARKALIKDNSTHWNEIRHALWEVGGEKCWYSEMVVPFKSTVIEHFRPKNRIAGETHQGYWWLSFDWRNFRISSHLANIRVKEVLDGKTKGKGTYFPLIGGARIYAYNPTVQDMMSIKGEKPLLLDPFVRKDVELLTFNHDGVPVPNIAKCKNADDRKRVIDSIELYCLNEGTLNAERAELWSVVINLGTRIEELMQIEDERALTLAEELECETKMEDLVKIIAHHAKFSSAAIAAMRSLGKRGWTEEVLAA